jgi:hypothetical protein
MRRIVAFPGFAVFLLVVALVVAANGWSAAPVSVGSAAALSGSTATPVSGSLAGSGQASTLAEDGAWLAPTSVRTLGVRGSAGNGSPTDSSRDHVASRMGVAPGSVRAGRGTAALPSPGAGLPGRTPLPPFVTTLPPPGNVRI